MATLSCGVINITLPNATFGDTREQAHSVIARRTRSGILRTSVHRRSDYQVSYTFDNIIQKERDKIMSLIDASKDGTEITCVPYLGTTFKGVLASPVQVVENYHTLRTQKMINVAHDGYDSNHRYTVTIDLKGRFI
jgi:hypothetical protein